MNSTHVVSCQIVLGTMEKEKAGRGLRMNRSCWWSFAISDRLIQKDLSNMLTSEQRPAGSRRQETCKYLGKEPPGDVKQGQGSPGKAHV